MSAANKADQRRTLWKAKLNVGADKQEFLFRDIDDFPTAARTAEQLLLHSPAAHMSGATIVAVERVAHLWN